MGQFRSTRAFALGIAGAGFFFSQAIAAVAPLDPAESKPAILADSSVGAVITNNGLYCLTLAIYFEGGSTGESEEGQRHIARVVNLRARADRRIWGGSDLCSVVFYERRGVCQFSFACLPLARRTPRGGPAWNYSRQIAEDELAGRSSVHAHFIRYYMNPALTPDRNACRFRREFVPVLVAGRHHFFREPVARERAHLATGEYLECNRLTKSKKPAQRAAKAPPKKKKERLATNP
jgi:spore germination cell wall hydrolase CwlJ-like protein